MRLPLLRSSRPETDIPSEILDLARRMVHHQETDFRLLGFVLRKAKADHFHLLEDGVVPGGPGGGSRTLKRAACVLSGCGWLFLGALHEIVDPENQDAEAYREYDAQQPGGQRCQARALRRRRVE